MSQLKTRSSARRGVALAAAVVLATAGVVCTIAPPAQAAPEPDPDLNSYVLFGFDTLHFKGGNGRTSIIDGGNIGVNRAGRDGNSFRMNVCANGPMRMSDNTMVVSDSLRLGDRTDNQDCSVYRVFTNDPAPNNESARAGTFDFQPPPITATPPFPEFTCNPDNPFTLANGSATMTPGVYGDVYWQNGTTVTLLSGTYTMCRIRPAQNVTVNIQPGVVLQIAESFLMNSNWQFGGSDCDDIPVVYVRSDGRDPHNDNSVRFSQNSEVWGHFYVPNGQLNLGHTTDLHGTFWARSIESDWNVDTEYCPPPLPEPETGTIKVTKKVTGARAGLPPGARFTVRINCTIPGPGVRNALDMNVKLRAGQTKKFTDVQVGTTCEVREVRKPRPRVGFVFDRAEFVPSRTVTITAADQKVRAVIKNPLRAVFGTIRVHKEVVGNIGGYVPGSRFGFALDCEGAAFDDTFTLAAGDTFISDPVRVGVPCTVTETGRPRAAPGFTYQDPVLTPDNGHVMIRQEDQRVTVHVTNRLVGSRPGPGTGPIAPS